MSLHSFYGIKVSLKLCKVTQGHNFVMKMTNFLKGLKRPQTSVRLWLVPPTPDPLCRFYSSPPVKLMLTGNSSVNYKTKNKGVRVGTKLYHTDSPRKPRTRGEHRSQTQSLKWLYLQSRTKPAANGVKAQVHSPAPELRCSSHCCEQRAPAV